MMKIDLVTGDLVRDSGRFVRVDGLEAVQQHVWIRLQIFREEVRLDQEKGMRFIGLLLAKGTSLAEIEGEISGQILDTPGVETVDDLTLDFDGETRRLTVDFHATVSLEDQRERLPLHDRITLQV